MAFSIRNEKKFKNQQAGGCLFGTQEYCKALELTNFIVQGDVLAIGSVDKVLYGKINNRVVHFHELVYERLHRFLLNKMEDKERCG